MSIASLLSKEGFKIDVFESAETYGGKMFRYTNEDGISWDTGPTLISLPNEIYQIFKILKKNPPELIPLLTGCRLLFSDQTDWSLPIGLNQLVSFYQKIDQNISRQFEEVMKISSSIYEFAEDHIFHVDPPSYFQLGLKSLSSGLFLKYPKITLTPYSKVVDSLITNSNLREFFYHFASYVGMNPDEAQGGILSVAHVELNSEIVFPKGGVYNIAEHLYKAALDYNAKFHFNSKVISVKLNENFKHGSNLKLTFEKEHKINECIYDIIISNSDPYVASKTWLEIPSIKKIFNSKLEKKQFRPSESQFVILFDLEDEIDLDHHIKIFPESWRKSFIEVCEKNQIPNDPCVYLVWPHATDKSVSSRVLFISAMAPNTLAEVKWDDNFINKYSEKILNICRTRLSMKLKGKIFKVITPNELEVRANSLNGGIYSATCSSFQPMNFHFSGLTDTQNLYFVGAGVHPGAGVTMVMKSARRIADHILKKFANR